MGKVVFCCCLQKKQVCPIQLFASKSHLTTKLFKLRYPQNFENSNMFSNFHFFSVLRLRFLRKPRVGIRCKFLLTKKKIDCCSIWKISSSSAHKILGILTHRRIIKLLVDLPNRKIKSFGFIYIPSHLDEISTQIEIESI